MIQSLVKSFEKIKPLLRDKLSKEHPNDYDDIVKMLVNPWGTD